MEPAPNVCPSTVNAKREFDWLLLVGVGTWAIVAYVELWLDEPTLSALPTAIGGLTILAYLAFLAGFLVVAVETPRIQRSTAALTGLTLQAGSVLFLQWLEPRSLNQILLIMWSSQLPYFIRLPHAILLSATVLFSNAAIRFVLVPDRFFWFEPLAYFTFSLFALVSSRNAIVAEQAREELSQRNAELEATQNLLSASAKETERLRIARDLHDSMGHHLTALALQLEILQHQHGEAAEQTQMQARQLVKLLLADVRATVSNLRSEHSLHVHELFAPLLRSTPRLQVAADIPENLTVSDPRLAETLLRATQEIITNTWRHANARHLQLNVHQDGKNLVLEAADDGQAARDWQPGNGLIGLQERVHALGGRCLLERSERGNLAIRMQLPLVIA